MLDALFQLSDLSRKIKGPGAFGAAAPGEEAGVRGR